MTYRGPLIKLLIFAVVTVCTTGLLGLTIANSGSGGKHDFNAIFTDATLLNKGDEVRIAGVRVGQVTGVSVYQHNKAKVSFSLSDRDRLPVGVRALIKYRNIAGERYLALERGPGDTTQTLGTGSTIPLAQTVPPLNLTQLFDGFRPLFQQISADDINKLSNEIIQVFQGESGTVESLISDTASLTSTLADRDHVIGDLITNLTKVLDTVNSHTDQVESLITNTSKFVSGLAQQRGSVGSAVTSLANLTDVTESILYPTRSSIAASINGLKSISDTIGARSDEVNKSFTNFPDKVEKLAKLASFGSWFQFYLCGIDIVAGTGKSTLLTPPALGLPSVNQPIYTNAATRCWDTGNSTGGGR